MMTRPRPKTPTPNPPAVRPGFLVFIAGTAVLVFLVALFWARPGDPPALSQEQEHESIAPEASAVEVPAAPQRGRASLFPGPRAPAGPTPPPSAGEIVAGQLSQFARSRRQLAYAMAQRHGAVVPDEAARFFDAVEAGNWEEIDALFKLMSKRSGQYEGSTRSPELDAVWPAVLDAYGAAEQVHEWPAQQLLDYGNGILESLRPGMVYVGGTDNGRWIPELLNDAGAGDRHVILTQNALADGRYLDYLSELYGDRIQTLNQKDSERAFREYLADAQRRLEHDRQFPDEPPQLRPGEDVRIIDGKVQVSGQVAVMSINERLLQTLMAKNPDLSFALQESSPLRGTYGDARPLGPLMELAAGAGQDHGAFTPEHAAQSLDYWSATARRILADPAAAGSTAALKSYSHDTVSAANLLAAHEFTAEAEQAYRISAQVWPGNPESASGLAGLLAATGRASEADQVLDEFGLRFPDQRKELEQLTWIFRTLHTPAPPP